MASSTVSEKEMEMVNERYMDMISGEFAYDPVRLPVEQDPTQALYNRKTLESIWETNHEALNPYTRQWFDLRSAIPQTELRREMDHYIQLDKTPSDAGELDVIADYNVILDEKKMEQLLNMLADYTNLERLMAEKEYWVKIWKKINLLRLCCQFHDQNIETFRYLQGFRYLNRFIYQMNRLLESGSSELGIYNLDVCKETVRAIDVIGLRPSDMAGGFHPSFGLTRILVHIYYHSRGFMKIQSVVLRVLFKIFGQLALDSLLGDQVYYPFIKLTGLTVAMNKLSPVHAKDISSEDLNYGIGILRAFWITSLDRNFCNNYLQVLGNAVVICIAREIPQRSHEIGGFTEGQVLEAQAQARHNSEALEEGLWVIKDMLIEGGPALAQIFKDFGGCSIVAEIVRMFKRFTEVENEDKNDPVTCPKGCRTFECVHIRIAHLGLGISAAISKGGPQKFDIKVLHKFLITCRERAIPAEISPSTPI